MTEMVIVPPKEERYGCNPFKLHRKPYAKQIIDDVERITGMRIETLSNLMGGYAPLRKINAKYERMLKIIYKNLKFKKRYNADAPEKIVQTKIDDTQQENENFKLFEADAQYVGKRLEEGVISYDDMTRIADEILELERKRREEIVDHSRHYVPQSKIHIDKKGELVTEEDEVVGPAIEGVDWPAEDQYNEGHDSKLGSVYVDRERGLIVDGYGKPLSLEESVKMHECLEIEVKKKNKI